MIFLLNFLECDVNFFDYGVSVFRFIVWFCCFLWYMLDIYVRVIIVELNIGNIMDVLIFCGVRKSVCLIDEVYKEFFYF